MKKYVLMCICVLVYAGFAQAAAFQTEMVSMNLTGDIGGYNVIIQYPFPPSQRQTFLTDLGGGNWQVDSFFDVFTEISVNDSPFQPGPSGTMQTTLITPEPSIALVGIGLLAITRRKR